MATYTDAALVEDLLKDAIGFGSTPELSDDQIDRMVALAMPSGSATSESLQRAVIAAWGWKAGLTADVYDIGGGNGKYLKESQWFDHCVRMADLYRSGALSVDGETVGSNLAESYGEVIIHGNYLTGAPR